MTHLPGITINQYQVDRAKSHNERLGLAKQTDVVRGNFCELPFPAASFDAAYAIEATCHGAASPWGSCGAPCECAVACSLTYVTM